MELDQQRKAAEGHFQRMRLKTLFPRARYGKIHPSEGMHHFTGVPENLAA